MIRHIFHLEINEIHKGEHCFFKILPLINYLCAQFRKYYIPQQNLSLDESMISYRGKASFKVYISSKPTKWGGIKLYCVCESDSGYRINCVFSPGDKKRKISIDSVVIDLLTPI